MHSTWRFCPFKKAVFIVSCLVLAFSSLASCSSSDETASGEIIVAIMPEAISLLTAPGEPDPTATGIPSLDSLNQKWKVQSMVPVFPDISPDDEVAARQGLTGIFKMIVPAQTDLDAMLADYQSDPNVDYVELNKAFEIK